MITQLSISASLGVLLHPQVIGQDVQQQSAGVPVRKSCFEGFQDYGHICYTRWRHFGHVFLCGHICYTWLQHFSFSVTFSILLPHFDPAHQMFKFYRHRTRLRKNRKLFYQTHLIVEKKKTTSRHRNRTRDLPTDRTSRGGGPNNYATAAAGGKVKEKDDISLSRERLTTPGNEDEPTDAKHNSWLPYDDETVFCQKSSDPMRQWKSVFGDICFFWPTLQPVRISSTLLVWERSHPY